VAPSLGQLVLQFGNWRWIFVVMALMAVLVGAWAWLRLPETLDPENRQSVQPRRIAGNMWMTVTTRSSLGYVLGSALVFGALFGYINSSQQLVGEHFEAADLFPLLFGATALGMGLASFTNARIVEKFGARRISHAAVIGFIAVSAVQVWAALFHGRSLALFMPLMGANMMLLGFIGANFSAIALQPFGRIAGAASSVQLFLRMSVGSAIGATIGQSYDGTARPLAVGLLSCGLVSLLLVLWSERGRLFRRLIPPGADRPVPDNPLR
jgi:DHA1 family bicyclomycin/chloramphenicol resistance-like MFS transporter